MFKKKCVSCGKRRELASGRCYDCNAQADLWELFLSENN